MHAYRTHHCAQLRKDAVGQNVRLSGWVYRKRDFGNLLFIDLRDHYGVSQVVIEKDSAAFPMAESLRSESVIRVDGRVNARAADAVNPNLITGEIEVRATEIELLSESADLPLPVFGKKSDCGTAFWTCDEKNCTRILFFEAMSLLVCVGA
jgi:aspartyl-tRNA synthetase